MFNFIYHILLLVSDLFAFLYQNKTIEIRKITNLKQLIFQATYIEWGPGIIFGVFCVIATLLQLLLPETSGKKLPQTVQELREWDAQKSNGTTQNSNSL